MSRRHLLLLAAAVTDSTFERITIDGQRAWIGKCLHCGSKLVVRDDGRAMGDATLEHIWPQTRGGGNDLHNIAVACARCNREKGKRHDHKKGENLDDIVVTLKARREQRWRDPDAVGMTARLARLDEPDSEGDSDHKND